MKIEDIEREIIDEFATFDEWLDKYEFIIELGKELPELPEDMKIDKYLISGCQSKLWIVPEFRDGRLYFQVDSDAIITKGIASLVLRVLSGQTPEDILSANLDFINKIGLSNHLSPTRSNGLLSMIKQIKLYAMARSMQRS